MISVRRADSAEPTFPRVLGSAHRDHPALQQSHSHISQQHCHLLGPGHTTPAPVIIGHVHAAM